MKDFDLYLDFMKKVEFKEKELNKSDFDLIDTFSYFLLNIESQESYFLLEKLIELGFVSLDIVKKKETFYFAHHLSKELLNNLFENSITPFHKYFTENIAELQQNNWELHKHLIREGVNPNEIAKAIRNDDIKQLQMLSTRQDFNVNLMIEPSLYERCSFINEKNVTLIDYAAFFGSVKCFKFLLMNNANVINTGKYAVAGGNEEIIHLCEQNHSSFEGSYEAAIEFYRNDIFHYIYENKIINYSIQRIIEIFFFPTNISINIELFTFFLEQEINVNKNVFRFYNLIFKNYIWINFFESFDKEYILWASRSGFIEIVYLLLELKTIDVNVKDGEGWTPLIYASHGGFVELVKLLLKQKVIDIDVKDNDGYTALMRASASGHTDILKILIQYEEIDLNEENNNGETIFMLAVRNGNIAIVKYLCEQYEIDLRVINKDENTLLISAAIYGHTETAKYLIEQEVIDINAQNKDEETALICASKNGHLEIVKLLLEQEGIDINAKDKEGYTALIRSTYNRHINITK